MGVPSHHPFDFGIFHSKPSILIHFGDPFMETPIVSVTGLRPPSPGGRGDQRPVGWQEWRATFGGAAADADRLGGASGGVSSRCKNGSKQEIYPLVN